MCALFPKSSKIHQSARDVTSVGEGLVTSITGTEEQRAALPHTTPEKERDAVVIAPRWIVFGRSLLSAQVAGNDSTFKSLFHETKSFKDWSMFFSSFQPKCKGSCGCNQQAYVSCTAVRYTPYLIPTLSRDIETGKSIQISLSIQATRMSKRAHSKKNLTYNYTWHIRFSSLLHHFGDAKMHEAFFVVAIFEVNWALRLLVVEPLTRLIIGSRGDPLLGRFKWAFCLEPVNLVESVVSFFSKMSTSWITLIHNPRLIKFSQSVLEAGSMILMKLDEVLLFLRLVGLGLRHLHHHRHCNRFMVKSLVK